MEKLLKLTKGKIQNLNSHIASKEFELIIKKLCTNKSPGPNDFTCELYQALKELIQVFHKLFQKLEEEETLPNSFYKPSITLVSGSRNMRKLKSNDFVNTDTKLFNRILANECNNVEKGLHI